jgi:hypothetical protein
VEYTCCNDEILTNIQIKDPLGTQFICTKPRDNALSKLDFQFDNNGGLRLRR